MANAKPERSTSYDEDSPFEEYDHDKGDVFNNGKQNGAPPARNVDRYGFMGGDHYTSPDEIPRLTLEMIRKREVKWIDMFENWEKWMTKRFKKVKARCRKGIPPSLRARAWQHLCGSSFLMNQNAGKYDEYLSKAGDPRWIEDIKKDLHRQFPLHEIFALRGGHGQEDLFRILKAYTIHNPQEGYCQAQGPIAAVLLMHMPAEQAFWCLVSICEKYLPGYYSLGLESVHIDGDVLFGLLKKSSPIIYKHLKKQRIEPILYMTEWFMCIFSRTLPWTAVLRVWDMFFCEGVKVMFRIALILFKLTLGTPGKLSECPSLYETMDKLKHIPHQMIDGDFIARESLKLNVDEKDMEREHQRQITKRRNLREKALKEASATKGKKEKKKLLGKLTKKDSESKQQQQASTYVTLGSQKRPEATQTAQSKLVLPISASSPTVGQVTTADPITILSPQQRWSADLDGRPCNVSSPHVLLYASQISTEEEGEAEQRAAGAAGQRSTEQLCMEEFAFACDDVQPQEQLHVQEMMAPMPSQVVFVPAEKIQQQLAGPATMAPPHAVEVPHAPTSVVSDAVPARVLPMALTESLEIVVSTEASAVQQIEGVAEPTLANARHVPDVAAPEVRMAMPQPQVQTETGVHSNYEVRPEGDQSQTANDTLYSDPMPSDVVHSDPVLSDVVHSDPVPSDVVHLDPVCSDLVHSDPVPSDVLHSDPVPSDPVPSDVLHSDPVPSDPVPSGVVHSDLVPSDVVHSDPVHTVGPVIHSGGVQSDTIQQPKAKSKSKSRSKARPVKIEMVQSDGSHPHPHHHHHHHHHHRITTKGGGGDGDSRVDARPTLLTSFGQRGGISSNNSLMSSSSSSKSTVTRRTKTRTTEEERTSTTVVRRSMETGETSMTSMSSSTTMSSTPAPGWREKPEFEGATVPPSPAAAAGVFRHHPTTPAMFNDSIGDQCTIVDGTPVDSVHLTRKPRNKISTTTSSSTSTATTTNNTTNTAITNNTTTTAAITNNNNTTTTTGTSTNNTTAITNNTATTDDDGHHHHHHHHSDATSAKTPNELSPNCDPATPDASLVAVQHARLSEEDMMSLRESRL